MNKSIFFIMSVSVKGMRMLVCLGVLALSGYPVFGQSVWEQRQKRVEEMRKEKLETPPQDKTIVKPQPEPVQEEIDEELLDDELTLPALEDFEPEETLGLKEVTKLTGPSDYINPEEIKISDEYGTIKEVHNAGPRSKLIIHVQDAHMNYDAQISKAHIVEDLLINYGINLILVEGGLNEEAGVGLLKWTGTREEKINVIKRKIKEGTYNGTEYLDAISPYPLIIRGLEDRKLYYESDEYHLAIMDVRPKAKSIMDEINKNVGYLKAGILNKTIIEMDQKKQAYNEEKISLTDYSLFIEAKAKEKKFDVAKQGPNFSKLLQTITLEQEIDFPGVDDERTKLIDELTKQGDQKKADELVQKSLDFRQGAINAVDYYAYLKDQYKGDLEKEYPNLQKYITYITLHKTIDTHRLFSEIDNISWDIRAKYYDNNEQKQLDMITRNLLILSGLYSLELTPDEYSYYVAHKKDFDNIGAWVKYINKSFEKKRLTQRIGPDINYIISNRGLLDKFYNNTRQRDEVFIQKASAMFNTIEKNVMVMVTGGFHTPNLVDLFHKNKFSYIVISPKIENPTPAGLYDKVMREYMEKSKKKENK